MLVSICSAQERFQGEDVPKPVTTVFEHSDKSRFWISGQANFIFQAHPAFESPYSGPNSLRPFSEGRLSRLFTLYTGLQATKNMELLFDVESAGGKGISDALGLAGFTNLDVVRNPTLGQTPYIARVMIHQIVALSRQTIESERGPFNLSTSLPTRRLELRAGKFSVADFFDNNGAGSDSHLQFMNWTVDNNGGYDYAADTRGYTYGVMLEYDDKNWSLRFAETLMPKVANGINLDWDIARARAENVEMELRPVLVKGRHSVIRLLNYSNHANMGAYSEAIAAFKSGVDAKPNIELHREQGRVKFGFGFNVEQELPRNLRGFARWGWNEGENESFAYTEVNESILLGADLKGDRWNRKLDKVGLAFVTNGISKVHQQYLALGGNGFLLGDGALDYAREDIVESYYTAHLWRGVFSGPDLQFVEHPGYNRVRGPVWVPGWRLHVDF